MRVKKYKIYSNKIKSDENIAVISNLQFNSNMMQRKLDEIIKMLKKIQPTYIAIPGNLFEPNISLSPYAINDSNRFQKFVDTICKIADTYYVLGNIENKNNLDFNHVSWPRCFNNRFYLPNNFHILQGIDNDKLFTFRDTNGICFSGINTGKESYQCNGKNETLSFQKEYEKYLIEIVEKLNQEEFNVLICNPIIRNILQEYLNSDQQKMIDLIISDDNYSSMFSNWIKPLSKENTIENIKILTR